MIMERSCAFWDRNTTVDIRRTKMDSYLLFTSTNQTGNVNKSLSAVGNRYSIMYSNKRN